MSQQARTVWRDPAKSSYSNTCGACVEAAGVGFPQQFGDIKLVAIGDTKDPTGPGINMSRRNFGTLVGRIKEGELDR